MLQFEVMERQRPRIKSGFTIVELLIVIVVVGILAAITVVSYRGITQQANKSSFAADMNNFRQKAAVYRTQNNLENCPTGYSFVYGNPIFGTNDFCVMKFEAKDVGGVATSQPVGAPWVDISQTDAITQSINAGGHLITDAEWMTIVADILSVKYNWSGGAINSGIIYQGHVASSPGSALEGSSDDYDVHYGITAGIGTNAGNNSSRVLYLSSGDAIWDLSGNVWGWTQYQIGSPTVTVTNAGVPGETAFSWRDYTESSLTLGNLPTLSRPSALNDWINPITGSSLASVTWEASKGVGQIYTNYSNTSARAPVRSGNWHHGTYAGVAMLLLAYAPTYTSPSLGFRVAR